MHITPHSCCLQRLPHPATRPQDFEYKRELVGKFGESSNRAYLFTSCPNSGDYRFCPMDVADPPEFFSANVNFIATNRGGLRWGKAERIERIQNTSGLGKCVRERVYVGTAAQPPPRACVVGASCCVLSTFAPSTCCRPT